MPIQCFRSGNKCEIQCRYTFKYGDKQPYSQYNFDLSPWTFGSAYVSSPVIYVIVIIIIIVVVIVILTIIGIGILDRLNVNAEADNDDVFFGLMYEDDQESFDRKYVQQHAEINTNIGVVIQDNNEQGCCPIRNQCNCL